MHRIGGLEKQDITGNVSYDPDNHQHMVDLRARKVASIADDIPPQTVDGPEPAASCWSSAGAAPTARAPPPCDACRTQGGSVAHCPPAVPEPVPARIWARSSSATTRCWSPN